MTTATATAPIDHGDYLFVEPDPEPLPRGPRSSENDSQSRHRAKILSAVIHETAECGFVETSVADIARRAKVSRRTFYEQFQGKDDAFLTAVTLALGILEGHIEAQLASAETWPVRLVCGMRAYVDVLTRNASLTRAVVLEIGRAGRAGTALERRHQLWWADLLRREVAAAREADPRLAVVTRELDEDLAAAVVVGMNGLVRNWLDHSDNERLLTSSLVLFSSVLTQNTRSAVALIQDGATQDQVGAFLEV